jgi:HAD superfamily hydrolase (TIGR01509 family)
MIKNIIFDIGNVLISFRPDEYLDKSGFSEYKKNIILSDIFRSREWELIDSGELSTEMAIERIALHSSLKKQEITDIFNLRKRILFPIDNNIKMLPGLKKLGFKLYFLSNFPSDIFDEVYNEYPLFKYFDGGIISARVQASKPGRRIFEILIQKYSLLAEECLFIDDLEPNVRTAEYMGMEGIWLYNPSELAGHIENKLKLLSES